MKKITVFLVSALLGGAVLSVVSTAQLNIANDNDLLFQNLEALTQYEGGDGRTLACYNSISNAGTGNSTHVTFCTGCEAMLAKQWSGNSSCN